MPSHSFLNFSLLLKGEGQLSYDCGFIVAIADGGVHGPVLCLIHIADVSGNLSFVSRLFTDDLEIFA
ncbi:unnamed protein product [Toxocara canis]|uniref:Uncharacterized protein n=1 Tax=Toxocara canis TaxID=6265 RepID=A0A183U902_TOXCA|nr:unnamed protein product [Toxocara canis]